eukprot:PhF_6_TR31470/c0_g1_i1/m.46225
MSEDLVCAVCTDPLVHTDDIRVLNCAHTFHFHCLKQWVDTRIATRKTDFPCPNCNLNFLAPGPDGVVPPVESLKKNYALTDSLILQEKLKHDLQQQRDEMKATVDRIHELEVQHGQHSAADVAELQQLREDISHKHHDMLALQRQLAAVTASHEHKMAQVIRQKESETEAVRWELAAKLNEVSSEKAKAEEDYAELRRAVEVQEIEHDKEVKNLEEELTKVATENHEKQLELLAKERRLLEAQEHLAATEAEKERVQKQLQILQKEDEWPTAVEPVPPSFTTDPVDVRSPVRVIPVCVDPQTFLEKATIRVNTWGQWAQSTISNNKIPIVLQHLVLQYLPYYDYNVTFDVVVKTRTASAGSAPLQFPERDETLIRDQIIAAEVADGDPSSSWTTSLEGKTASVEFKATPGTAVVCEPSISTTKCTRKLKALRPGHLVADRVPCRKILQTGDSLEGVRITPGTNQDPFSVPPPNPGDVDVDNDYVVCSTNVVHPGCVVQDQTALECGRVQPNRCTREMWAKDVYPVFIGQILTESVNGTVATAIHAKRQVVHCIVKLTVVSVTCECVWVPFYTAQAVQATTVKGVVIGSGENARCEYD